MQNESEVRAFAEAAARRVAGIAFVVHGGFGFVAMCGDDGVVTSVCVSPEGVARIVEDGLTVLLEQDAALASGEGAS